MLFLDKWHHAVCWACSLQWEKSALQLISAVLTCSTDWACHIGTLTLCRGGCLELYNCNMVEWFWWNSNLILMTNWFPSVFWHCWFGHPTCKNHPQNDLLCVEWDVNPYTLTHTMLLCKNLHLNKILALCIQYQRYYLIYRQTQTGQDRYCE